MYVVSHGTSTSCMWFEQPLSSLALILQISRYQQGTNCLLHLTVPLWILQPLVYPKLHVFRPPLSLIPQSLGAGVSHRKSTSPPDDHLQPHLLFRTGMEEGPTQGLENHPKN